MVILIETLQRHLDEIGLLLHQKCQNVVLLLEKYVFLWITVELLGNILEITTTFVDSAPERSNISRYHPQTIVNLCIFNNNKCLYS